MKVYIVIQYCSDTKDDGFSKENMKVYKTIEEAKLSQKAMVCDYFINIFENCSPELIKTLMEENIKNFDYIEDPESDFRGGYYFNDMNCEIYERELEV